jgi:hypothetical protein
VKDSFQTRSLRRGRARSGEKGQVLIIVVIFLAIVLLGIAALVIDIGRAYYAHRSLQASADAAALAGAQELPDAASAQSTAMSYGGHSGGKNDQGNIPGVTTSVTTKCITSLGKCDPVNAIVVTEHAANVPTLFARILGIDHFSITARATAAMGQGVPKPAHIMIIFDRTNSMNQSCTAGSSKATCVRDGIKAFLQGMDPKYDQVGLIAYPPGNGGNPCTFTPHSVDGPTTDYDAYPNGYLLVPLSTDYKKADGTLDTGSQLVSTVNCVKAQGTTATAPGIDKAQQVLAANHDPKAQDVIIFLTDGEANYGPCTDKNNDDVCENNSSPYRATPCHQAAASGQAATAAGTWVYGIAYDTPSVQCWGWRSSGTGTDGKSCNKKDGFQFRCTEVPSMTAYQMVQQIASDSSKFFNQPNPGDLTKIFESIAVDLTGPVLVDDDAK